MGARPLSPHAPTPRTVQPMPGPWLNAFAQSLVEVLSGRRPVSQLRRHLAPRVLDGVIEHVTIAPMDKAQVSSFRVQRHGRALEVCVVLKGLERSRAMALRMQHQRGRWVCTSLMIG